MNETIKHQLNHRTIRFYQEKPVEAEIRETIYQVINQTASSIALQAFTVIRVSDPVKRAKIAEICKQPYVKTVPEFLLFLIDCHRNSQLAQEQGHPANAYHTVDFFFQGAADAYLAAQNATNAIESLGLGAVYFGSVLNDAQAIIDLFDLPPLVMPLLGLGYGYPNDAAGLKPRMSMDLKLGENVYPKVDNMSQAIADYDAILQTYYDTRNANQRSESFSHLVTQRYQLSSPLRNDYLKVARQQGFEFFLNEE